MGRFGACMDAARTRSVPLFQGIFHMKRLACISGIVLLFGFAPVPSPRCEIDPDRAIAQLERALHDKEASIAAARKQKLIESLRRCHAALVKKGRIDRAEVVRARLLLVQTLQADHLLGDVKPADLLGKAAVDGKYKNLMRVLLVPNDQSSCNQFTDFGFWNGTAYANVTDLKPGYWVYVYPRWFVWSDGPPRP
jgi:hypothetical protein